MSPSDILNATLSLVVMGVGGWVTNIGKRVTVQEHAVAKLQVDVARDYMPRADTERMFERVFDKLDEIQREVAKR